MTYWRWAGERLAVDPNLGSVVYFGSRNDGLWRSLDSGATWTRLGRFPTLGTPELGLVFVVLNPASGERGRRSRTLYVGASGAGVYASRDGGETWRRLPQAAAGRNPQRAAIAADGSLFVSFLGAAPRPGGVVRYRDGHAQSVTPLASARRYRDSRGRPSTSTERSPPLRVRQMGSSARLI